MDQQSARESHEAPANRMPRIELPRPMIGRSEATTAPTTSSRADAAWRTTPSGSPFARPAIVLPERSAPPVTPRSHVARPLPLGSAPVRCDTPHIAAAPTAAMPPTTYHQAVPSAPRAVLMQQQPPVHVPAAAPVLHVMPRPAVPAAAGGGVAVTASRWRADAPTAGRFAWFTPVHAGALLCIVLVAWIVTHGPSANFRAGTTAALPPIAGATSAPAGPVAAPGSRQDLPLKAQPKGMPSAASAASIAISRGDTADARAIDRHLRTTPMKMQGIPSAAAAETMAPKTLPLRPSDGMTLPRAGGQRDDHGVDQHYGDVPSATPAADVQLPVTTPGQAAAQAEAARHPVVVTPGDDYAPTQTGMYHTQ